MLRPVLGALAAAAILAVVPAARAELSIRQDDRSVTVTTGAYRWVLSTRVFSVVHSASVSGQARLGPGQVSVDALGSTVIFGRPTEVTRGADWVELRGWVSRTKNLWYVARYQFFDGRPFARLVLSIVDRHDRSPEADPFAKYWRGRVIGPWRLEIGAPGGEATRITQHNSVSHSVDDGPWVETVSVSGAPYRWAARHPGGGAAFQIEHDAGDPRNQVVWHPGFAGRASLGAVIERFTGGSAHLAATGTVYEVVDARGRVHRKTVDQDATNLIQLGTFDLGKDSVVRLLAAGKGRVLAGSLRVAPEGGTPFDVRLGTRAKGVLSDGPLTLAVKDFWQHHPASLVRTRDTVGWEMIERPAEYTGGMGLTIETMIAIDGPPDAAVAALEAPPARSLPRGLFAADGTTAGGALGSRYDALLGTFADRIGPALETQDSFGWRDWGDYQIGESFTDDAGQPVEDWANLQYDLPHGLLLAWIRTGDPRLWRHAQASVRHLMDLDLVKFYPFEEKLNGLVYRKGQMPPARSHIGAEPIADYGYAWRSLLLYHHLTGERWAQDLARQNIDRLVYYATTRPRYVVYGDRPTAWMLRAALAGAAHFPDDPRYREVADRIVKLLVLYYRAHRRLPGRQPVWQGQMVDGLAWYHARTGSADVAEVIVGHVRHLLEDCVRRTRDGGYEFLYCDPRAGGDCATPQWVGEDNYAFLWLSAIAYAHHLSKDAFFARWADELFAHGEKKIVEHHDVRSWTSLLGFPHLYLELSPLVR